MLPERLHPAAVPVAATVSVPPSNGPLALESVAWSLPCGSPLHKPACGLRMRYPAAMGVKGSEAGAPTRPPERPPASLQSWTAGGGWLPLPPGPLFGADG
jgi:hypothetical protein